MIELLKSIILGAVQGITEFLPVSSTGHLIIFEKLLGVSQKTYGLSFDAALHLGTLVAILWYFRKDWIRLFQSLTSYNQENTAKYRRLLILLIIGTIPAVLIGLPLEDIVDSLFRSPLLVGITLIIFSLVLFYVEKVGKKSKSVWQLRFTSVVIIGFAQSIALIPGVSRSGITIAAGMWLGMTRSDSAYFAFLLSAPIVAGAGGKKLIETLQLFTNQHLSTSELLFFAIGIVSSAVFGYLTIKYFLKYLSSHSLYPFIFYRIILGLAVIGIYLIK